jgi:hypothetical protein
MLKNGAICLQKICFANDDDDLTMLSVLRLYIIASDARMINECGSVGGIRTGMGNHSIQKKLTSVPLCAPQIYDLTWDQNQVTAVENRLLTT